MGKDLRLEEQIRKKFDAVALCEIDFLILDS